MKKLRNEIPEGYDFEKYDPEKREVILKKQVDIRKVIAKSFEAVLDHLGELDPEVVNYKKIASVFEDDPKNHLLNYQKAVVLIRAINDGWEPDWDNGNERKYFLWFDMGSSSGFRYSAYDRWRSLSAVGSRLAFKNYEDGQWLFDQYPEVFENFMLIKK